MNAASGKADRLAMLTVFAVAGFSLPCSAISVELSVDRNGTYVDENLTRVTMLANESLKFQIKVYEGTKTSSGAFSIYEEVAEKTYKLVGKPHFAYAACACKGSRDMPDLNEEYTFIPVRPGKYRAEALYGGVSKRVDIDVIEIISPTTSTTSMTNSAIQITSSTTQAASATTTTTTEPPTTSLKEPSPSYTMTTTPQVQAGLGSVQWLPALLVIALISSFLIYYAYNKRGRQSD